MPLLQFRLGVKEIHLGWRTFLKEEDDVLCLGSVVGGLGGQRVGDLG